MKEFELIKLSCWVNCIFSVEQDIAIFCLVIQQEFGYIVHTLLSKYCIYELESWRIKTLCLRIFG